MKAKRILLLVVLLLVGAGVAVYFLRPSQPVPVATQPSTATKTADLSRNRAQSNTLSNDRFGRFAGMSAEELMRNRPKLHATKVFPPMTPEEIEMWQWWNAIDKVDPSFEWKMPVEFYGKVLEQREQPVPGATVHWDLTIVGGTQSGEATTQNDGRFVISGQSGKRLGIQIWKKGYQSGNESRGSFEFAAFHEDGFYVPDPDHPVPFHLQKLDNPEPMYQNSLHGDAPDDGKSVRFDLRLGKVVTEGSGDLVLEFTRHERPPSHFTGYTITIEAPSGGGLAVTNDEFMYSAPESGYQPRISIEQKASQGPQDYSFHVAQQFRFYVKTSDGKYAAVSGDVAQYSTPTAGYDFMVYYNPSGSRNLEFDDKKRLPTPDR